jgi:hypothetical protein
MDKSKLPGLTKKSSETPWSPTHERKKLSNRAGTVVHNPAKLFRHHDRSWAPGKNKAEPYHEEAWPQDKSNIAHGKDPKTGKPVKRTKVLGLHTGPVAHRLKNKKDEKEY